MIAETLSVINNAIPLLAFLLFGGWLEREYGAFSKVFGKKRG